MHEPDAVREIIVEADAIAGVYDVGTPEWIAHFNKAVDLLAARVTLMPQTPPMIPDLSFPRQNGRV